MHSKTNAHRTGCAATAATLALAFGAALLLGAPAAFAQAYDEPDPWETRYEPERRRSSSSSDAGPFSIRTGLGFTGDPTGFLLGFEGDYLLDPLFSVGGQLHIGVDDDQTIVSPLVYGRFHVPLEEFNDALARLDPYIHTGLGFTWWDVDRRFGRPRDDDDLEFLLNFGLGVEYELNERIALGTQLGFNIIPSEIFDERFYFSWEVLTVRYRF